MKLEINEMWSINNANIDIGKINIIGGNSQSFKTEIRIGELCRQSRPESRTRNAEAFYI